MKLLTFLKTATVSLALAATLSLKADPITPLGTDSSGTSSDPTNFSAFFNPLNLVISNEAAPEEFSAGSVSGTLTSYVYKNISPHGGMTFVYELKNTTVGGTHGISWLDVGGWLDSLGISLGYGDTMLVDNGGTIVNPGGTDRYPETGMDPASLNGVIRFTFPPGSDEPPIFSGEQGMQLILFTSADWYAPTTGYVVTDEFDPQDINLILDGTQERLSVSTFTASSRTASVPDGGTTALLLGAAFVSLAVFSRKARRSAA